MPLIECRECGRQVSTEATACPHCGCQRPTERPAPGSNDSDGNAAPPSPVAQLPSGNDPTALAELRGWNWGAYGLSWIWALAHRLTLLGLITLLGWLLGGVVGIAFAVYLGAKGNELAWRSRPFRDLDGFREVQRPWAVWGHLVFVVQVVAFIAVILISVLALARVARSSH